MCVPLWGFAIRLGASFSMFHLDLIPISLIKTRLFFVLCSSFDVRLLSSAEKARLGHGTLNLWSTQCTWTSLFLHSSYSINRDKHYHIPHHNSDEADWYHSKWEWWSLKMDFACSNVHSSISSRATMGPQKWKRECWMCSFHLNRFNKKWNSTENDSYVRFEGRSS